MKLPAFKHGDKVLNESYAACLYLEVRALLVIIFDAATNELIIRGLFVICVEQCLLDKHTPYNTEEKKPELHVAVHNSFSFHVSNNRTSSSPRETS